MRRFDNYGYSPPYSITNRCTESAVELPTFTKLKAYRKNYNLYIFLKDRFLADIERAKGKASKNLF